MVRNSKKLVFVAALLIGQLACGGSPTDPSDGIPTVAGTYTGTISFRANGTLIDTCQLV